MHLAARAKALRVRGQWAGALPTVNGEFEFEVHNSKIVGDAPKGYTLTMVNGTCKCIIVQPSEDELAEMGEGIDTCLPSSWPPLAENGLRDDCVHPFFSWEHP